LGRSYLAKTAGKQPLSADFHQLSIRVTAD
jgi:hypothetical protein